MALPAVRPKAKWCALGAIWVFKQAAYTDSAKFEWLQWVHLYFSSGCLQCARLSCQAQLPGSAAKHAGKPASCPCITH